MTAQAQQDIALNLVFDPFGHQLELQAVRQRNDGRHHRRRIAGVVESLHERAVDLELADGQLGEVRQRRIAGAEVVDRDAHAVLGEAVQHRPDVLQALHQAGFGDLEFE